MSRTPGAKSPQYATHDAGRPDDVAALVAALENAQRLGTLGDRPIPEVVEHAGAFVAALAGVRGTVLDLGTGAGVPGLVVALHRPDLHLVLVDRRTSRTDALRRTVRRLGWNDRVEVVARDVDELIRARRRFPAVIARGFGPPDRTLSTAARLVEAAGLIVISEPPAGRPSRWSSSLLADAGVVVVRSPDRRVACFRRTADT